MKTIIDMGIAKNSNPKIEKKVGQLKDHARNLYESRQFLCTEAVLISLNKGLDGELTEKQAVSMAAPFCIAMGDSGCMCGALSGAVLATGLFIGNSRQYAHRKDMRKSGLTLHNAFRAANGSTCCRVLSKKVKHDKKAHFNQCADITANAAEMAARLILQKKPDLVKTSDNDFSTKKHNVLTGFLLSMYKTCFS